MSKQLEPLAVGEFVFASSGVYSSYGVSGFGRVVRAFDPTDFATKDRVYDDDVIDYTRLVTEGYIEEFPTRELWTGQ